MRNTCCYVNVCRKAVKSGQVSNTDPQFRDSSFQISKIKCEVGSSILHVLDTGSQRQGMTCKYKPLIWHAFYTSVMKSCLLAENLVYYPAAMCNTCSCDTNRLRCVLNMHCHVYWMQQYS